MLTVNKKTEEIVSLLKICPFLVSTFGYIFDRYIKAIKQLMNHLFQTATKTKQKQTTKQNPLPNMTLADMPPNKVKTMRRPQ